MLTIENFDTVCQQCGLTELKREFDEIIIYGIVHDGHPTMQVEYSDCMDDDYADVIVSLDDFHSALGDFHSMRNPLESTTTDWLKHAIDDASAAYDRAELKAGSSEVNLYDLNRLLRTLSYGECDRLTEFNAVLSGTTLKDIFDKVTKRD